MTAVQLGLSELFQSIDRNFKPSKVVLMKVSGHLVAGLVILLFAHRELFKTKESIIKRLGLRKPKLSVLDISALALGSLFFGWMARQLALKLFSFFGHLAETKELPVFENLTTGWGILMILTIAIAPGFVEEIAYRGFLQRGLIKKHSPFLAIFISSVLFGLAHITPQEIVFTFFMGLWLGIISYRTNSIWPTIFCHITVNGWSSAYMVGKQLWTFPVTPPMVFNVLFCIAFVYSIKILVTKKKIYEKN
ncbi:CPBP family intramembrane glutamic endopeptidase [Hyunsoonleella aquatilis]|nr:CPBP family intramembrane glutamic endopeptidase [Hyunsoonleella aquatilis]